MNVNENCSDEISGVKHENYLGQISRAFAPFEGEREDALGRYTNKGYNHVDVQKTANDYIGAKLRSIAPVTIYSRPNGELVKAVGAGRDIGTIFSYVEVPKGTVWWHLEDGTFVKHQNGVFDIATIEASLKAKKNALQETIDKAVQIRKDANDSIAYSIGSGKALDLLGGIVGKVLIGVIAAVIIGTIIKFS